MGSEYKDLQVTLGISARASAALGVTYDVAAREAALNAASLANGKILSAMRDHRDAGWEPEVSTDFLSLFLAGRISWEQTGGVLISWRFEFYRAMILLKRVDTHPEAGRATPRTSVDTPGLSWSSGSGYAPSVRSSSTPNVGRWVLLLIALAGLVLFAYCEIVMIVGIVSPSAVYIGTVNRLSALGYALGMSVLALPIMWFSGRYLARRFQSSR